MLHFRQTAGKLVIIACVPFGNATILKWLCIFAAVKHILILCPYPARTAASQRFRFEQYLPFLQAAGYTYTQVAFLSAATWGVLYQPGHRWAKINGIAMGFVRRFLLLFKARRYHYVLVHREAAPLGPPVFEWCWAKLLGKKLIYDFDDAIWLPNTSQSNKLAAWLKWHGKVAAICRYSYKVSAGNEYLFQYAQAQLPASQQGRVVLNPTTIDTVGLHKDLKKHVAAAQPGLPVAGGANAPKVVIGWTGTHSTLKYLKLILPALQQLQASIPFTFRLIADQAPNFEVPNLEFVPWQKAQEMQDLMALDIGLMPLTEDPWSKGKCGFKALQYLALGIPALVSPVAINAKIVEHGRSGYHCQSQQEWFEAMHTLALNPELRNTMGGYGRATVQKGFSVKANLDNFLSLFT